MNNVVYKYEDKYERLPLVEKVADLMPKDLLGEVYLLACQHILPSTHLMLRSMVDLGLKRERMRLIGKCYSTSKTAMEKMSEEGFYVCPSSSAFNSHRSFDEQFKENITQFIASFVKEVYPPAGSKIVILDDGGELLLQANELLAGNMQLYGVEQTSSGYHKLSKCSLTFPIINVARSRTKLGIESPMIIDSVMQCLEAEFTKLKVIPKHCLIMGNGTLGQCIYEKLHAICETITRYDCLMGKSDIRKEELNLAQYDMIIGTTGQTVLDEKELNQLQPNTLLASISSSDREFAIAALRKKLPLMSDCHLTVSVKGFHILNGGFPLNFSGNDKDTVPLEKIQLTIALLFSGVCQILTKKALKPKFIPVAPELQAFIRTQFAYLSALSNSPNTNTDLYYVKPSSSKITISCTVSSA